MKSLSVFVALAFLVGIIGCTAEERGAGTGMAIGAGVGAIIGHQSGETATGAVAGAMVGTIAGYLVGKHQAAKSGQGNEVSCPHCRYIMGLPGEAKAGDIVRCPNCRKEFILQ